MHMGTMNHNSSDHPRRPKGCASVSIEPLEQRQHLTVVTDLNRPGLPGERLTRNDVSRIIAAAASQALSTQVITVVDREGEILGVWAGTDARLSSPNDETGTPNLLLSNITKSLTRARTGAFFQSREDAFSTRTARYIIQDQFPFPVPNTPGGPLYGVEFSTLPFSDFSFNSLGTVTGPAISGDPGGIPLFKNNEPVGGIGVSGDGRDLAARDDLPFDPRVTFDRNIDGSIRRDANGNKIKLVWDGNEESDFDEAVAIAGAAAGVPGGGTYTAPFEIQAERILVGGLRFPFDANTAASGESARTIQQLINAGEGNLINPNAAIPVPVTNPNTGTATTLFRDARAVRGSPTPAYPAASFGGIDGELKNQRTSDVAGNGFGFVPGGQTLAGEVDSLLNDTNEDGLVDADDTQLTVSDVKKIIAQAGEQALHTRAAIREPIGVPARVHISVVDRAGRALGTFRQDDGTNFSYDVSIQKARTANYFSDNDHAFTPRAIGFLSQQFFPLASTKNSGGPLFRVQNALSLNILSGGGFANPVDPANNPLANGMTIFPGGAPLYKDGVLVGAIGVSGDGVDQDDIITFAGTRGFRIDDDDPAKLSGRSDFLKENELVPYLKAKVGAIFDIYNISNPVLGVTKSKILANLDRGLDDVRLPYVKFPRNPDV